MNTVELMTCFTAFVVGLNVSVNVVLPTITKTKIKKEHKLSLQAISRYDGYLINQEKFNDYASLYKVEVLKRDDIKVLFPYVEKIANYVGDERLKLLYTNLKTASVEQEKTHSSIVASCDPIDKVITYNEESNFGHELLHLASAYYNKLRNEVQSGFSQVNCEGYVEIGRGLNEGYTEHLAFKIFGEDKESGYRDLVIVARLLEMFFDDPKDMEDFYFGHDLPGFIHYMEKFIPYDKMMGIILELDKINRYKAHFEVITMLDLINIEMELYSYFIKTNPSLEKLIEFESIINEGKVAKNALKREKRRLVKEYIQGTGDKVDASDSFGKDLTYRKIVR